MFVRAPHRGRRQRTGRFWCRSRAYPRPARASATALVVGADNKVELRALETRSRDRRPVAGHRRPQGRRPGDRRGPAKGEARHPGARDAGTVAPAAARTHPAAAVKEAALMSKLLHRPADLRLGDRHRHHAGRRAGDHDAAGRAVPDHRAARRSPSPSPIPAPRPQTVRGHGHPGHRAADERHRPPALLRLDERLRRQRARSPSPSSRAPIPTSPRCRCRTSCSWPRRCCRRRCSSRASGRQVHQELPARRRLRLDDGSMTAIDLADYIASQRPGPDQPHAGVGDFQSVRLAVRHAHLARPGQAQQLRADARRRDQRDPGAERAGRRRASSAACPRSRASSSTPPSSAPARLQTPEQFGNILLQVEPRRLAGAAARRRAHRARRRELSALSRNTTASRPRASRSSWRPAPTPWTPPTRCSATIDRADADSSRPA